MLKANELTRWVLCDLMDLKFGMEAVELEVAPARFQPGRQVPQRDRIRLTAVQPALRAATI